MHSPKFSGVGGPVPIFKKFPRAQFLLKSLDSFFTVPFKVSSFQENQVWGCTGPQKTRKTKVNIFQPIISESWSQLSGTRDLWMFQDSLAIVAAQPHYVPEIVTWDPDQGVFFKIVDVCGAVWALIEKVLHRDSKNCCEICDAIYLFCRNNIGFT